jgi:thymidylate synthase
MIMMNNLDKQYTDLLQTILDHGVEKKDRTGTGTKSIFGYTIRHNMADGFPLLTTKKMAWKSIVVEMLWFLNGDTNIRYLVQNGCNIWNGDAYKAYAISQIKEARTQQKKMEKDWENITLEPNYLSQTDFIEKIKTDYDFGEKWGDLGPIYGNQWRKWGSVKQTNKVGWLKKEDTIWYVKWFDLQTFGSGPLWNETKLQNLDQNLSDEDIDKEVYFEFVTIGYDEETFYPNQVAKLVNKGSYVNGIDQLADLINQLKTNPDSRRLMVNAWNVSELPKMVLPPCHYGFQCYTRELSYEERNNIFKERFGETVEDMDARWEMNSTTTFKQDLDNCHIPTRAISLMWNQRSVDTFLGLPFNIASYGLLLSIIAKEVNMVPDQLIGNLGDTHLYLNHLEQAKEQIGRELSYQERYDYWFANNYETGMEKNYEIVPDFEHEYYDYTPTRTREPLPLPTLKIKYFTDNQMIKPKLLPEQGDEEFYESSDFILEGYKSHSKIDAPLSN